ncbi:hypothetical protein J6590_049526 [Homalodisca vitripennis]|nr:hypothetical protein J6590_049526 [Homalodisca vitripennis]
MFVYRSAEHAYNNEVQASVLVTVIGVEKLGWATFGITITEGTREPLLYSPHRAEGITDKLVDSQGIILVKLILGT